MQSRSFERSTPINSCSRQAREQGGEMLNENYKQFMKLFKLHEQVFVGFKHGSTHGFISHVDPYGFALVQLANAKELFYPWDQFNLISVPGVKIDKVSAAEETHLWKLLEKANKRAVAYAEESLQKKEIDKIFKAEKEDQLFLSQEGLCGVRTSELNWQFVPPKIKINTKNGAVTGNILWHTETYSEFLTTGKIVTIKEYTMSHTDLSKKGYESTYYSTDEKSEVDRFKYDLNKVREGTFLWEKEYVCCGDPWKIHDVESIDGHVFHTAQGPVMTKFGSDLWF
jgi:hypothetical protein